MNSIRDNVSRVREQIASACNRAGRSESDVRLIAVTKFVDCERISEAIAAGLTQVGENRAQELTEKLTFFKQHACCVHFIGQLQTNKIKYVCGVADIIHSVDRLPLAEQLQKRAASMGIVQDIMLQVNVGAESQKGGVDVGETLALMGAVSEMQNLRVRGLMCVPPALGTEQVRAYFAAMRNLLDKAKQSFPALPLTELSMGMTHDFETAIEEGATMVRVGTGIFGQPITNG